MYHDEYTYLFSYHDRVYNLQLPFTLRLQALSVEVYSSHLRGTKHMKPTQTLPQDLPVVIFGRLFMQVSSLRDYFCLRLISFSYNTSFTFIVCGSPQLIIIGAMQSLFEGSMYTFVMLWVPAIRSAATDSFTAIPFGLIFSSFMIAC